MTDCTVIIPIGPGHMQLAEQAMASVVGAVAAGKGAFDQVYVVAGDDGRGEIGRSAARNQMVAGVPAASVEDPFAEGGRAAAAPWMGVFGERADEAAAFASEWLFFLDADDLMCGPDVYGESAFEVVAPYLADWDCVWGTIHEFHQGGQIMRRKQVDRITTRAAYVKTPAALSCQMGHFVRREAFLRVGGFDEKLDVCEDVDLYLREWEHLRCIKQEKPLFLNRRGAHSWMQPKTDAGGRKVHTGREWSMRAEEMLKEARRSLP